MKQCDTEAIRDILTCIFQEAKEIDENQIAELAKSALKILEKSVDNTE